MTDTRLTCEECGRADIPIETYDDHQYCLICRAHANGAIDLDNGDFGNYNDVAQYEKEAEGSPKGLIYHRVVRREFKLRNLRSSLICDLCGDPAETFYKNINSFDLVCINCVNQNAIICAQRQPIRDWNNGEKCSSHANQLCGQCKKGFCKEHIAYTKIIVNMLSEKSEGDSEKENLAYCMDCVDVITGSHLDPSVNKEA